MNRDYVLIKIKPIVSEGGAKTRLYFGPVWCLLKNKTAKPSLGLIFSALHGFHLLYLVALSFPWFWHGHHFFTLNGMYRQRFVFS